MVQDFRLFALAILLSIAMLRRIDRLAIKMGSNPDWQRCFWCWKWGKTLLFLSDEDIAWGCLRLTRIDEDVGRSYVLCEVCQTLAEPPWYPNASDRAANAMRLFLPAPMSDAPGLLKHLSWFVVKNDP